MLGKEMSLPAARYLLDSVESKVLRYTKRHELVPGLDLLVAEIAAQRYRTQQPGSTDAAQTVASITDGDQSVSFKHSDSDLATTAELSDSEKVMLNEWRSFSGEDPRRLQTRTARRISRQSSRAL